MTTLIYDYDYLILIGLINDGCFHCEALQFKDEPKCVDIAILYWIN